LSNSGVITDIGYLATCAEGGLQSDIYPIRDAAVAFEDGCIVWVGAEDALPVQYRVLRQTSAHGKTLIPGLVDCHTHLAFGGWRADEFGMRIEGKGYLDIAAAGGGIRKTMRQTREADSEALLSHCQTYLKKYLALGVTAVECKTGYGLSKEAELKILRVYQKLRLEGPIDIVSTLLAAHIIPPDDKCNRESYIKMIIEELIPLVAKEQLAEFNDVFVEEGAYTYDEAVEILEAGLGFGLLPKLHVDQLSDGSGGELAAQMGAISADHLEFTSQAGIEAMAAASVTGVCLPFASLYLNQPPMKARSFINAGVGVAVATDFNPGSAPSQDLPLALMLACTMSRMTPSEAVKGATLIAAKAIRRDAEYGSIEIGKRANFAELDAPDIDHWLYHFQPESCVRTWIDGDVVFTRP
jgi:imidazolonepropionase